MNYLFMGLFKYTQNFLSIIEFFRFNRKKNFYIPLAYIFMISKTFELYDEVLFQFKRFIEKYSWFKDFNEIKVLYDFEIPLRKPIKINFPGCILQGYFFHIIRLFGLKLTI